MGQEKDSSPNIEKCIQMVDLATLTQKETRAMITQKRLKGSRFDLVPELLNPITQIHFIKGKDCNGIVRVSPKKKFEIFALPRGEYHLKNFIGAKC